MNYTTVKDLSGEYGVSEAAIYPALRGSNTPSWRIPRSIGGGWNKPPLIEVSLYKWIKRFSPMSLEDGSTIIAEDVAKLQKQL